MRSSTYLVSTWSLPGLNLVGMQVSSSNVALPGLNLVGMQVSRSNVALPGLNLLVSRSQAQT